MISVDDGSRGSMFRLLVVVVIASLAGPSMVDAAAFFPGVFSNNKPKVNAPPPGDDTKTPTTRIRTTMESDLPVVAKLLSTASVSSQKNKNGGGLSSWKNHMDQLLARVDIEALLTCRLQAVQEGQKAYDRLQHLPLSPEDRLKVMWATSDKLRGYISKASAETGESNVWKEHNFALTPQDASWLNHLQMTTEVKSTGQVVGFCEVAMLSNPLLEASPLKKDRTLGNRDEDDEDDSTTSTAMSTFPFSPAITNLATAPEWRRRGIAKRMLRVAERFARLKWSSPTMGLYVEKSNEAAMGLYRSLGYKTTVTCSGGERLGELWYMVKELDGAGSTNTAATASFSRPAQREMSSLQK